MNSANFCETAFSEVRKDHSCRVCTPAPLGSVRRTAARAPGRLTDRGNRLVERLGLPTMLGRVGRFERLGSSVSGL